MHQRDKQRRDGAGWEGVYCSYIDYRGQLREVVNIGGKITQHHKQVDSVVFVKTIMSIAPSAGWPTYTRDKQTGGRERVLVTHHP